MWHNHISDFLEMFQAEEFRIVTAGIFAVLSFGKPWARDITPLVHPPPSSDKRDYAFLNQLFAVLSPDCIRSTPQKAQSLKRAQSEKLECDIEPLGSSKAGVQPRSGRPRRIEAKRCHLVVSSMTQNRPIKHTSRSKIVINIGGRYANFGNVASAPIRATPLAAKIRPIGRPGKRVVNRSVQLHGRDRSRGVRNKAPSRPHVAPVSVSSVVNNTLQNAASSPESGLIADRCAT